MLLRDLLREQIPKGTDMTEPRIVQDPSICAGKPTIRGTRILVHVIAGMAAGGYTVAQILNAYPELTDEDVRAALSYPNEEL